MRSRGIPVVVAALLVVAGLAGTAAAHQSAVKYADVTISGARATVAMTIAPSDVTQPLGLAEDAQPTVEAALVPATLDRVSAFVASWLAVRPPDGAACAIDGARAARAEDPKFLVVTWNATCGAEIDALELDFTRFFELDQRHEVIVTVHAPGETGEPTIVRADNPVLSATPGGETSWLGWIRHGMHHIYEGIDHILFVLALLLVVVITRVGGEWRLRAPMQAVKSTAVIITAFTLAHSASLIAASLGLVSLPSRFVESVIAASIVYTAIEDIAAPDVRWRFSLTLAFGLVHGLGFASVLAEILPPEHVVLPLLLFNLGVEVGQLSIVVVAIPVLWWIARSLGPTRYRRVAIPVLSLPLILVGGKWLIERAFDM